MLRRISHKKDQDFVEMIKPCLQNVTSNQFDNFLKNVKTSGGIDGFSWLWSNDETFPDIFNAFSNNDFSFLVLNQGLGDLIYNLQHNVKTDIRASQTVKTALKNLEKELNIVKRSSSQPEIILQDNLFDFDQLLSIDTDSIKEISKKIKKFLTKSDLTKTRFGQSHFTQIAEAEMFGPTTSGFLMFSSTIVPLLYSFNGTVDLSNDDHQNHKIKLTLQGSLEANIQTSLGVMSPFTQNFIGSGVNSKIQVLHTYLAELNLLKKTLL